MRRQPHTPASTLAQQFVNLRADYSAAKSSRFRRTRTGVSSIGSGADYHYRTDADYLKIMELARDMARNDTIVGPMLDRLTTNVVQDGFKLDTQTGSTRLDKMLSQRWADYAGNPDECDVSGELAFADMERLILRQCYVDGDILALGTEQGPLQLIEAHRVRTPSNTRKNVVHGVLLDQLRRRLEYWVTRDDIDPTRPLQRTTEVKTYPVRDAKGNRQVFHIYDPKRVTQTRGVSALAPIVDTLGMFEDINFAKLVQQQVVSCFAVFRQRDGETAGEVAAYGAQESETQTDGSTRTIQAIAPGMEVVGAPGETLTGFSPNIPNPEFFDHVRLLLTLIGVNLSLPLVMLMLDASETNFSGWRGAVDQARMEFRRVQGWLIRRFHRPVYTWKVRQWLSQDSDLETMASGQRVDVFRQRWNPPTWPYIQPLQDANADNLLISKGLSSPRRVQAARGRDEEELAREIVEDHTRRAEIAIAAANKLNAKYPDLPDIDWRELLGAGPQKVAAPLIG